LVGDEPARHQDAAARNAKSSSDARGSATYGTRDIEEPFRRLVANAGSITPALHRRRSGCVMMDS
jgi:hypothetical protein